MRLYLLRHARAEVGGNATGDDERALTDEGHGEAADVGSWLASRSEPPTHILCSTARRAEMAALHQQCYMIPAATVVNAAGAVFNL